MVICTLNRGRSLRETLRCLRHQNYAEFEVVVVNGPSTDDTDEVANEWAGSIRYERCPVPNLSVSRNIGIRAAAGDIVAFIDDDALPEFDWLQQAIPAFEAGDVAGVGGIVFDHTGLVLQYKYSAANRFGEATSRLDQPYDDQCAPGTFQFPYLQGTNALFRRSALLRVGGFDETFEYYLDETDLCCRLVDAGYVLRQLPDAPVHHKFLPSNIRDHARVVSNWFPIMKNQVYFSYRHALEAFSEYDINEHSQAFLQNCIADASSHELAGRLPIGSTSRAAIVCAQAIRVGTQIGMERRTARLGPVTWEGPVFSAFSTIDRRRRRKITFVSSGYVPNMTGGIARFISELAPALACRGHEVRVITRSVGPAAVDFEDGVWVHRVDTPHAGSGGFAPDSYGHVNDFTTAAVAEIERIAKWSSHDVVYGPLWDVEVLGALRKTALPIAVQVATPLAVAAEMAGMRNDAGSSRDVERLMALEADVLDEADLFHANSSVVEHTIVEHYGDRLDMARWGVVHLGVAENGRTSPVRSDPLQVFFVGRFEARKGIDTFLDAVAQLAPLHPNACFTVAGEDRPLSPGDSPYGQSWAARHAKKEWIGRVRFVGTVDDERLHELYAGSDVVVLPSRYESFGLVMVEAMMHGRALVSCDTSGIRDVVRNGIDGILVPPGDVEAIVQATSALLDNPARRVELGAAARQRFLDAFHIDRFAERFEQFLDRVHAFDASHAVMIDPYRALELGRSPFGGLFALLQRADAVEVTLNPDAVARVVVDADEASVIEIKDGDTRIVHVATGRMGRFAVSTRQGRCTVTVIEGTVRLHGVIEVGTTDES